MKADRIFREKTNFLNYRKKYIYRKRESKMKVTIMKLWEKSWRNLLLLFCHFIMNETRFSEYGKWAKISYVSWKVAKIMYGVALSWWKILRLTNFEVIHLMILNLWNSKNNILLKKLFEFIKKKKHFFLVLSICFWLAKFNFIILISLNSSFNEFITIFFCYFAP